MQRPSELPDNVNAFLAVVGPSGAGKSTCMKALTGFAPADVGTVLYNGRDLYEDRLVRAIDRLYLLWVALTHKYVFDIHEDDIYFCTADIGWVTGHSYVVYGPLCNGGTTLMFEGVPTWPDALSPPALTF